MSNQAYTLAPAASTESGKRVFRGSSRAAPTSPGFFLHSYMHNIAAASPHELADGEPEAEGDAEQEAIVNRLYRLHRMLQRTNFCLLGLRTYLAHQRGRNLAAQRDISCACCSTKQGLQPTRSIIVVAMRERIFVKRSLRSLTAATRAGNHRVV